MAATRLREQSEGEHDGGAWKVAYADFVTALMALFIVLWLMNAGREVRQAIGHYFRDPNGKHAVPKGGGGAPDSHTGQGGSGMALRINTKNVNQLKLKLREAMRALPQFEKFESFVQFTVTDEGLRVELMENEGGMFFESGSPRPTSRGETLFDMLAKEMGKLPNDVSIEGHTDARPFRDRAREAYGNWELSFDRANMTRRFMLDHGLREDQIVEIRGYADHRNLVPDPLDSRNRRVSVVLKYDKDDAPPQRASPK